MNDLRPLSYCTMLVACNVDCWGAHRLSGISIPCSILVGCMELEDSTRSDTLYASLTFSDWNENHAGQITEYYINFYADFSRVNMFVFRSTALKLNPPYQSWVVVLVPLIALLLLLYIVAPVELRTDEKNSHSNQAFCLCPPAFFEQI